MTSVELAPLTRQHGPTCPLCGSAHAAYTFSERGYKLQRCQQCDLFYVWPYPEQSMQRARVETYAYENLAISSPETYRRSQAYYYSTLFPKIRRFYTGARRVLDVGAGAGNLLRLLADEAPQAELHGIELNAERAAYVRRETRATIYETSILDFETPLRFDVVSLINVFSHVPVTRLFDTLVALLQPGGHLILKVSEMHATVRRSDYHDWEIPDHIQFLGMRTIAYLAQRWNLAVAMHERVSIADAMFTPARFAAPGRSKLRNGMKLAALKIPGALPVARSIYRAWKGERFYTSVVVLRRNPS